MHTLLDKGPRKPEPLDNEADEVAVARHKTLVREHDEWHEKHKEPIEVRMHSVDAQHAIASDPERYSEVGRDAIARRPGGLEDRLTAIEDRLDVLEEDEVEPPPPLKTEPRRVEPKKVDSF